MIKLRPNRILTIMNLLKQLVGTKTDINLLPSELMQHYPKQLHNKL